MAEIGINVPGAAEYTANALAQLGARIVRCKALADKDISSWLQSCTKRGIETILVLDSDSLGTDEAEWADRASGFYERYRGLPTWWQVGNEPDGQPDGPSWTMDQAKLARLIKTVRGVVSEQNLMAPGLVSGHPTWIDSVDLSEVNAMDFHPYDKWTVAEMEPLLSEYFKRAQDYGIPLFLTEFGAPTAGEKPTSEDDQASFYKAILLGMRDEERIKAVLLFCISDAMDDGFGIYGKSASGKYLRKKPSYKAFVDATGGPLPVPAMMTGQVSGGRRRARQ